MASTGPPMPESQSPLPPIKIDPRYGWFPRWPQDGDAWVHPEDRELARKAIPSPRVWRRDATAGPLDMISYGGLRIRVAPALWQQTPAPAYAIGDWVEVRTELMQREPHTGQVCEIEWDEQAHQIIYRLNERGQPLPVRYLAEQLIAVDRPTGDAEPVLEAPEMSGIDGIDELVEGLPIDEHQKGSGDRG